MATDTQTQRCFACGRKLGKSPKLVDTRDGQLVYVGSECFKLVVAMGEDGYRPLSGGPRLYLIWRCPECNQPLTFDGNGVATFRCDDCKRLWPANNIADFAVT